MVTSVLNGNSYRIFLLLREYFEYFIFFPFRFTIWTLLSFFYWYCNFSSADRSVAKQTSPFVWMICLNFVVVFFSLYFSFRLLAFIFSFHLIFHMMRCHGDFNGNSSVWLTKHTTITITHRCTPFLWRCAWSGVVGIPLYKCDTKFNWKYKMRVWRISIAAIAAKHFVSVHVLYLMANKYNI